MKVVSARAAALRILAERAAQHAPLQTSYSLADHQVDGAARARTIMRSRGGVLVADDVGLGKTYIAAALAEDELAAGGSVLIILPAALRSHWRRVLQPLTTSFPDRVQTATHTQLSRRGCNFSAGLVIVDEAHGFRNPRTRRYLQLRRLCRRARVALLTATPINNALSDLYFQLRLYAPDNAFCDLGIGSLKTLLTAAEPDPAALRRLSSAALIRRTRSQLLTPLDFPRDVTLHQVMYPVGIRARELKEYLDPLALAAYPDEAVRLLIRISLLKRLQSSVRAAVLSLERLIRFHQQWLSALEDGRLLQPKARASRGDDDQLIFVELLLPAIPRGFPAKSLKAKAERDLDVLIRLRERLDQVRDPKLDRLADLLAGRPPPARTLVFTEFRDTAQLLWRRFLSRQVGLITGSDCYLGGQPATRMEVVRRFAPNANCAQAPADAELVSVLVATDVLSEGLNLQDASTVVNYDLPWNPVRLIQRAGRINRLGSPHAQINVFNFMPDADFDELIGLIRRLRAKLHGLRTAVGQETDVLEPHESLAVMAELLDKQPCAPTAFDVDLSAAGPTGSVGCTSPDARGTLLCCVRKHQVRELIFARDQVFEDSGLADQILEAALASEHCGAPPTLTAAIEGARSYLERQAANVRRESGNRALAAAIRHAVQAQGVLLSPELLSLADKAIRLLPGYFGPASRHIAQLRILPTTSVLAQVLEEICEASREAGEMESGTWQVIAAVASD